MWTATFADLVLGSECLSCGEPGAVVCAACHERVVPCPARVERTGVDVGVWAASSYEDVVRKLIPAYKDHQALRLEGVLAKLLAASIAGAAASAGWRADFVLVPVRSSTKASRERGYQHVERLVRRAAGWLQPRPAIAGLLRHRGAADQGGLDMAARHLNLHGRMIAARGNSHVVVCDDVVTTGATLAEAVRALREAGHTVRGCCVVAHTPRRHGGAGQEQHLRVTPPGVTAGG